MVSKKQKAKIELIVVLKIKQLLLHSFLSCLIMLLGIGLLALVPEEVIGQGYPVITIFGICVAVILGLICIIGGLVWLCITWISDEDNAKGVE